MRYPARIRFFVEAVTPKTQARFDRLARFVSGQPTTEAVFHLRPSVRAILGDDFNVAVARDGLKIYDHVPGGKLVALIDLHV